MLSAPIDLALVRRLFATPARITRHAGSEFLRREVATRMHEKLALVNLDAKSVFAKLLAGFAVARHDDDSH